MRRAMQVGGLAVVLAATMAVGGCRARLAARGAAAPCWLEVHRGSYQRRYPGVSDRRVLPGDGSHLVAFCGPVSPQDRSKLERSLRTASVTATELSSGERRPLSVTGRHPGVMASPLGTLVSGCIDIGELPAGRWSIRVNAGPDVDGVSSSEMTGLIVHVAPPESPREHRAAAWRRTPWWDPSEETARALQELVSSVDGDPAAGDAEKFMLQVYLTSVLLHQHRAEEALRYGREAEATAAVLGDAALAAARRMQACADVMMRDSTLSRECGLPPFW